MGKLLVLLAFYASVQLSYSGENICRIYPVHSKNPIKNAYELPKDSGVELTVLEETEDLLNKYSHILATEFEMPAKDRILLESHLKTAFEGISLNGFHLKDDKVLALVNCN